MKAGRARARGRRGHGGPRPRPRARPKGHWRWPPNRCWPEPTVGHATEAQLTAAADLVDTTRRGGRRGVHGRGVGRGGRVRVDRRRSRAGGYEHFVNPTTWRRPRARPRAHRVDRVRVPADGTKVLGSAMYILSGATTMADVPDIAGELTPGTTTRTCAGQRHPLVGVLDATADCRPAASSGPPRRCCTCGSPTTRAVRSPASKVTTARPSARTTSTEVATASGGGRPRPASAATMEPMASDGSMVIVVEDDEHIAKLVELYLRQDGHDVHRGGDAVAAMQLCAPASRAWCCSTSVCPGTWTAVSVPAPARPRGARPSSCSRPRRGVRPSARSRAGRRRLRHQAVQPRELAARTGRPASNEEGPPPTHPLRDRAGPRLVDPTRRVCASTETRCLRHRSSPPRLHLARTGGAVHTRREILDGTSGTRIGTARREYRRRGCRPVRKKLGSALPLATVWGVGYRLA